MSVRGPARRPPDDRLASGRLRRPSGVDRLLESSRRPAVRPPLTPRLVVCTATPALVILSAMLDDADRRLSAAARAEVARLVTDGARSPLHGTDAAAARAAAEALVERRAGEPGDD